jgi:hypothetical protein
MFNPSDVKVAKLLTAGLAVNGTAAFAAPANNANRNRYLLGFQVGYSANFAASGVQLEDVNGNLLVHAGTWVGQAFDFIGQPLLVGVPGANGLVLRNTMVAGEAFQAWVMFADIQGALVPAFAVNA